VRSASVWEAISGIKGAGDGGHDGGWRAGETGEAAQVAGDVPFRAERPFPVEIVPSRLVAKLRAR
jgi:hypothetical protein